MTSPQLPDHPAAPDLILLALFQSRLRDRSLSLTQSIQSQQRRLADSGDESSRQRLQVAEEALAAVQQAQTRMGDGRYGLCQDCQEPIGMDELLEAPERLVCVSCRHVALRQLSG